MEFTDITPQWLENKYEEFNQLYFNNKLGNCHFGLFTSGKGSQGHTLGHFFLDRSKTSASFKCEKRTRRIFLAYPYGDRQYVDRNNFFALCHPTIELNGNYRWTEQGAEETLIHEMCHYYTYMRGFCPVQGHGTEFREIAALVSQRSGGRFTVKRLATAEELANVELDPEIKAQNEKRKQRKLQNSVVALIYTANNEVRLLLASDNGVINTITDYARKGRFTPAILKIKASADDQLKQILIDNHYTTVSRSYRYWPIQDKPIYQEILNGHFEFATVYTNNQNPSTEDEYYTKGELFPDKPQTQPNPDLIPHFRFTTMNGNTIEYRNISKEDLFNELKSKFPKWPDGNIQKIIENPRYNLKENRRRVGRIQPMRMGNWC